MTDLNSTAPLPAGAEAQATGTRHPATFAPATFILLLALSVFGAVIGVQLILQLGVTPNTSIIGALVAMILARVPIAIFARYRSIHVQNLAQSAISAATFGAQVDHQPALDQRLEQGAQRLQVGRRLQPVDVAAQFALGLRAAEE